MSLRNNSSDAKNDLHYFDAESDDAAKDKYPTIAIRFWGHLIYQYKKRSFKLKKDEKIIAEIST